MITVTSDSDSQLHKNSKSTLKALRMAQAALETEQVDFSLSAGGLAYEFFRWSHLSGDEPRFVRRRVALLVTLAWVPPLLLTVIAGTAYSDALRVSFVNSLMGHVRFLIVLPILIGIE